MQHKTKFYHFTFKFYLTLNISRLPMLLVNPLIQAHTRYKEVWKHCNLLFLFSCFCLVSTSNPFYLHTEHRNMPLDDAMRLVGQNFDQYMQDLRERAKGSSTQDSSKDTTAAVPKDEKTNDITALLSKAATGASLSADQLTKLIDNLSKRQEEVLGSSTSANGKGGKNPRHDFLSAVKGILTTLSRQLFGAIFIFYHYIF